jgi:hypothetical protein
MFEVSVDRSCDLVEKKLAGFLTVEEVHQVGEALAAELAAHALAPGTFLELVDIRELTIQSQEVVQAFALLSANPALTPKRLAFCTGPSPARMQARKAAMPCPAQLFETRTEALAWLLGFDPSSSAVTDEGDGPAGQSPEAA